MAQDLRLFNTKHQFDGESVDVVIDDLQFRKLRQMDIGARVILEAKMADEQQARALVTDTKPAVRLKKRYAQVLGPGVNLENVEILEAGESEFPEAGSEVKGGTRVVFAATNLPLHGWGKAVGHRET